MGTAVNIEVCPSNMKSFAFLAIVLVSASAIHIPEKYAHYKPGYMRIPDWEKIMSGEKKLNQKEPTMTFEPRNDYLPRADCGIPNAKATTKLLEDKRPLPINSRGKWVYSLMDISVVAPSFPKNT